MKKNFLFAILFLSGIFWCPVFIDVFLMVIAVYGINFFVPRFLLIVLG